MQRFLICTAVGLIAASAASAGEQGCGISIAASHSAVPSGGQQHVRIDLASSEYRVDDEPWRSTRSLCEVGRLDLARGETAVITCRHDAACGRYTFLFRVDVLTPEGRVAESRLVSYPMHGSGVEVRRGRSVNLGNVRALLEKRTPSSTPLRRAAQRAP